MVRHYAAKFLAGHWSQHAVGVAAKCLLGVAILGGAVAPLSATRINHKPVQLLQPVAADKRIHTAQPAQTQTKQTTPSPQPQPPTQPAPAPTVVTKAPTTPTPTTQPAPAATSVPAASSGAENIVPTNPEPGAPVSGGYTSTNWAGYIALRGAYSGVSGSWRVPQVTGNGPSLSADATWIGIGGVFTNDLIQVGTENTVSASGKVESAIFYELLPDAPLLVSTVPIAAGDSITASILERQPDQWVITISNTTRGKTYSTEVTYVSSHSSAEWIEEAPSYANGNAVPLDFFGTSFFNTGTTTVNGASQTIRDSDAKPLTLIDDSGRPLATPSVLTSDGSGFNVTRQ